jgi:alpha-N-acetylglucosaminidase
LNHFFASSCFYKDDAVEMASFVLGQKADEFFDAANFALSMHDTKSFQYNLKKAEEFLANADKLLESHSLLRLERWVAFARQHGESDKLKDYYEENAKRIVTSWGPPVNDYSARIWSGLIRDFYLPRMDAYMKAKANGEKFNRRDFEEKWLHSSGISKIETYSNPAAEAYRLVRIALSSEPAGQMVFRSGPEIGAWNPASVSTKWKTVEYPIDPEQLKNLIGVRFTYTKGKNKLMIQSVALLCDGIIVASDHHRGETGHRQSRNTYTFALPKQVNANNGIVVRAVIKSSRGVDSYGKVELVMRDE